MVEITQLITLGKWGSLSIYLLFRFCKNKNLTFNVKKQKKKIVLWEESLTVCHRTKTRQERTVTYPLSLHLLSSGINSNSPFATLRYNSPRSKINYYFNLNIPNYFRRCLVLINPLLLSLTLAHLSSKSLLLFVILTELYIDF